MTRLDVKQPDFGVRLRALRRERRLSQTDLAGTDLSPSYVSLLEHGRRIPTPQVVQQLAAQLQVDPSELASHEQSDDDLVLRLVDAADARDERDLIRAAEGYRSLAEEAARRGEGEIAWSARWELSEVLRQLDEPAERARVLEGLGQDPTTTASPRLSVRVWTALADATRHVGSLDEARSWARRAVDSGDDLEPDHPGRVRAVLALLSAEAERGQSESALSWGRQLLEVVDGVESRNLRTSVHWAVGNVLLLTGDHAAGMRQHDLAFQLAVPAADPRQWGRLCKASALLRLPHDLPAAGELAATARHYLTVAGTATDLVELDCVDAELAHAAGEHDRVVDVTDQVLAAPATVSLQDLSQALVTRSRSLWELGRRREAADALRRAGEGLDSAGAHSRASTVWRELSERLAVGA